MVLHDWPISSRCDGTLPLPGYEVALNIKCIVDGSGNQQFWREALLLEQLAHQPERGAVWSL